MPDDERDDEQEGAPYNEQNNEQDQDDAEQEPNQEPQVAEEILLDPPGIVQENDPDAVEEPRDSVIGNFVLDLMDQG